MLRYLALGLRNFGIHPMAHSRRVDWEFYAVLQGRAAPVVEGEGAPRLRSRTLWVFPPEHRHGWIGEKSAPCKVAAFQFAFLPDQVTTLSRERGFLEIPLSAGQAREIERFALELQPHHDDPTSVSELVAHRVMLQLCLMVLAGRQTDRIQPLHRKAHAKVTAALAWYEARLAENPPVEAVARALHVSPSYLRRLFWEVREQSPKRAFRHLQMERVVKRMSASTVRLEDIASDCGFASASELCRAFKTHFKVPPAMWRKSQLPLYREPVATGGEEAVVKPDTRAHRKLRKYIRFM